jgi:hypothetical protein
MQEYLIVTFSTTTSAMIAERTFKAHGIRGRLIPLPRQIDAGCGMAWAADPDAREEIEQFLTQQHLLFDKMVCITF